MHDDPPHMNPEGALGSPGDSRSSMPRVPNHTLVRVIAEGGRGDVWLACDTSGTFRAAKVVYRTRFQDENTYGWELHDVGHFQPISLEHEGLVRIVDAGQNEEQGYLYYVMELGDDENAVGHGTSIDAIAPESYQPRTLQSEIRRRAVLPATECVAVTLTLARVLGALHAKKLVHSSIRTSQIIVVQGRARLGGIARKPESVCAHLAPADAFRPPEGAGTPQGDIYSLGKVLYEMATGNDAQQFPQWPHEEAFNRGALLDLRQIILKACADDPGKRYASCAQLCSDLSVLEKGGSIRQLRWLKRAAIFLATVVIAGAVLWKQGVFKASEKPGPSPENGTASLTPVPAQPESHRESSPPPQRFSESGPENLNPPPAVASVPPNASSSLSAADIKAWRPVKRLFAENFERDSSTEWIVKKSSDDTAVIFGYDYSEMGIPLAPGSERSFGLKLAANMALPKSRETVSLSPRGRSFSGNYRLKFRVWLNANGPFPEGGKGSTQFFTAGIGTDGHRLHWRGEKMQEEDGIWFSVNGDGDSGSKQDFYAFSGTRLFGFQEGAYAAGMEDSARGNLHPYYASIMPGGQTPPPLQRTRYPSVQTGSMPAGCMAFAWRTMEVFKMNQYVSWSIDGLLIATVRITNQPFSDNVFVGYADCVDSVADQPELCFAVVTDLTVDEIEFAGDKP